MSNGSANLGKFHRRKRYKSCSKDLHFFVAKVLRNGRQLLTVFSFQLPFFFRRRRPMNITGVVAGNPRFHHIKTVLS